MSFSGTARKLRRVIKVTVLGVVTLSIIGCAYQALATRGDRTKYPPNGELVSVAGHNMHIYCQGQGNPTVVFDAGLGGWSIHWASLLQRVAKNSRACAFDRSGMGWSDAGSGQFDALTAADELHDLLITAGTDFPIVYVGHSIGANFGQVYTNKYRKTVAGLVLVEPGLARDMLEDYEGTEMSALAINSCGLKCSLSGLITRTGIVRLLAKLGGSKHMDERTNAMYHAGSAQPKTVETIVGYLVFLPKTAFQTAAIKDYGDIPVRIVASSGQNLEEQDKSWYDGVLQEYADMANMSTRGRGPIVIRDSTHLSVVLAPHAVEELEQIIIETRRISLLQ